MATVVLSAIGTLVGGPLGGAVGSLIGSQVDKAIIGGTKREGPRLKDLAVTTSSYGHPVARHFGTVRTPGTIIWSTELKESREKSGGGKGKPSTTTYSYSVSFAVALASRPIDGVGRIWADGNLLRGAAGDLKSAGAMRIHKGHADQQPDPLMAAALGGQCPAHRGCAYVVFEDLALADFGNRIPALSFEVTAGSGTETLSGLLDGIDANNATTRPFPLKGYSHDGGTIGSVLAQIDRLKPIVPHYRAGGVHIEDAARSPAVVPTMLPEPAVWSEGDFGQEGGAARSRSEGRSSALAALRYYDPDRDYQPGLQRVDGSADDGKGTTLEFPGVLDAAIARDLLRTASVRDRIGKEILSWRIAELDPSLRPGMLVRVPGHAGTWSISGWEWRESGIELELVRHLALEDRIPPGTDAGSPWHPLDRLSRPTELRVFELPWDGLGSGDARHLYAAAMTAGGPWAGAALYAKTGTSLQLIGHSGPLQAIGGELAHPLGASSCMRFESAACLVVRLGDPDAELVSTGTDGLARGANRLLVGSEVMQFAHAEPLGNSEWKLTGLLRGRGGTELAASVGHDAGAEVTLLDEAIVALDSLEPLVAASVEFAAVGPAETEAVIAALENQGSSRQPPSPCHGKMAVTADGSLELTWVRRARGGWQWLDEVEQPLVEQSELYEIGIGPASAPHRFYYSPLPHLTLDAATRLDLEISFPGEPVWVRQSGSFGKSRPLLLGNLSPASSPE